MTKIKERLTELQPYVLSIRFKDGFTVIDTLFKEGWMVPKSDSVGAGIIDGKPNYYMLHPLTDDVDIDEMLDYVNHIIKLNVERELKLELLQQKVSELQEIFKNSSLQVCKSLEFNITTENAGTGITLGDMPILTEVANEPTNEVVDTNLDVTEKSEDISGVDFTISKNQKIEFPPKKGEKIEVETFDVPEIVCNCGPNSMCPVCEHEKY
jgi:hypothetical protein